MRKIRFISPSGELFDLTEPEWEIALDQGGLTGFVGETSEQATIFPGVPGQVVENLTIGKMTGSLTVSTRSRGTVTAVQVWERFRSACRMATVAQPATLTMESLTRGTISARVRAEKVPSIPDLDPDSDSLIEGMKIDLVCDDGHWLSSPITGQGTITVINSGDVFVAPKIGWSGGGGRVELPSGATFTLPASPERRVLDLNPRESLLVTTAAGVVDDALWGQLREVALPEGIPSGQSRTFKLPEGAELSWRLGFLDPWI